MSILITSETLKNMDYNVAKDNRRQSYRGFSIISKVSRRVFPRNFLFLRRICNWMQHDRWKNSATLSFPRCFGPRVLYCTYIYTPLSPPLPLPVVARTRRSIASDLQNLWRLFCLVLILILVPPVQHAADRVVSGTMT